MRHNTTDLTPPLPVANRIDEEPYYLDDLDAAEEVAPTPTDHGEDFTWKSVAGGACLADL